MLVKTFLFLTTNVFFSNAKNLWSLMVFTIHWAYNVKLIINSLLNGGAWIFYIFFIIQYVVSNISKVQFSFKKKEFTLDRLSSPSQKGVLTQTKFCCPFTITFIMPLAIWTHSIPWFWFTGPYSISMLVI